MKILILTQYYPPEIGAPQNRLHELAVRLKAKGSEIEVIADSKISLSSNRSLNRSS